MNLATLYPAATLTQADIYSSDAISNYSAGPDMQFVAGLIFGFSGDNNLTEVETCITSSEQLVADANICMDLLHDGKTIAFIEAYGALKVELADNSETCHSMSDDLDRFHSWASVFDDSSELIKIVGKNWLKNKTAIQKDMAAKKTDWAAGNYFNAGIDFADAITLAVGPVPAAI